MILALKGLKYLENKSLTDQRPFFDVILLILPWKIQKKKKKKKIVKNEIPVFAFKVQEHFRSFFVGDL